MQCFYLFEAYNSWLSSRSGVKDIERTEAVLESYRHME